MDQGNEPAKYQKIIHFTICPFLVHYGTAMPSFERKVHLVILIKHSFLCDEKNSMLKYVVQKIFIDVAKPNGKLLILFIIYRYKEGDERFIQTGKILKLKSVNAFDNGRYICSASNILQPTGM